MRGFWVREPSVPRQKIGSEPESGLRVTVAGGPSHQNPHPFVARGLAVGDFQLADRYPQQLGQDGQHGLVRLAILRRGAEPDFEGAVFNRGLFDLCPRHDAQR
jgi:hypothetical protein